MGEIVGGVGGEIWGQALHVSAPVRTRDLFTGTSVAPARLPNNSNGGK
jgi:hypothetical protein